ncbi:Arylsulfatase [Limihaloglobus sulfuriphilus]|uniref:Arylsulfatase n=1 Tax=Limihaloglobus sulfuriphilus TaxID=1851148 RepID=A0A1Q2MGL6_9BACT|nr:sulfatase-like hydrolase/transferase [Limihaloglobus sulfuriphilus]AQQ71831.1 Arylsulfatase [Limihaloglobus sulfuriphilus]
MANIDRRDFLRKMGVSAAALGLGSSAGLGKEQAWKSQSAAHNSKTSPNVVVIFIDQLRSFALGCYGNETVNTPHIDNLARQGYRFDLGISNNPVCVPARAALLSGQHARTCVGSRMNEMTDNHLLGRDDRAKFKDATIAELFKDKGYKTALIGKWHTDARPTHLGFEQSLITNEIFSSGSFVENEKDEYRVPVFSADHEIAKAREFFRENKSGSRPFFLYYNIISPHMPLLDVPYKYTRMYDPEKLPLRPNVWREGKLASNETWFHIYMWQKIIKSPHQPITAKASPEFTVKDLTALYYGSITWTDDIVGQVLDSLKENGLEDNTIVVLAADHGDMLGSQHRWNKDRPYEEAIRVPMIYRWPGRIKKGENKEQVTSLIDVMPTILELCETEIPSSVQGRSVASLMDGSAEKTSLEDNYAFIETPFAELAIRTPTHLYAVKMDESGKNIYNDKHLFFDLRTDPYEQKNLLETGEQSEVAKELRDKIYQWHKNTPIPESFKYDAWAPNHANYINNLGGFKG